MEQLAPHRALTYMVIKDIRDEQHLFRESHRHMEYLMKLGFQGHAGYIDEGQRGKGWEMLEKHLEHSKGNIELVLVSDFEQLSGDVGWVLLKQAELEDKYGVTIHSLRENQLGVDKEQGLSFR